MQITVKEAEALLRRVLQPYIQELSCKLDEVKDAVGAMGMAAEVGKTDEPEE